MRKHFALAPLLRGEELYGKLRQLVASTLTDRGELRGDLAAQEPGHLLGCHCQHRLSTKLLVKRGEPLTRAKFLVRGVLHLHQAPAISLAEGLFNQASVPSLNQRKS
jgi:hypothetical protein